MYIILDVILDSGEKKKSKDILGTIDEIDNSTAAAAAKSLQLCPTLFDPIDCSPPGSSIPGILQARIVE